MMLLTSAANINTSPQALSDNQSDAGLGNFLGTVVPPYIRKYHSPKNNKNYTYSSTYITRYTHSVNASCT